LQKPRKTYEFLRKSALFWHTVPNRSGARHTFWHSRQAPCAQANVMSRIENFAACHTQKVNQLSFDPTLAFLKKGARS
jgi:hypothetical protein